MTAPLPWCRQILPDVSRTFSIGIRALPPPIESWVTVAYLLCRVIDTVEDAPGLTWLERRALFLRFEDALNTGESSTFVDHCSTLPPGPGTELARGLAHVLAVLERFPEPVQTAMRRWVVEMLYGMALYARRESLALYDTEDLERYCYFVAGTVGHLLTDLFSLARPRVAERRDRLEHHAEGFGRLLQLTNIIKDVSDDWRRGRCFIPTTLCAAQGIEPTDLLDPDHRRAALAVIDSVGDLARSCLPDAVSYVLNLPSEEHALRRFCLFPMLMATRTLEIAAGNPAVVTDGAAVKVDRETVRCVGDRVEGLLCDEPAIASLSTPTTPPN